MSNVTACLLEHFGRKSPIEPYREDMAGDAKELIASGMDSDAAWRQVTEAKLSELRAERARITGMVSEAYAKTPAGKKALEQAKVPPDETPKSEKPRVFKIRKNAEAERKRLGNEHKLQKIKGGYMLRRKTDKEMAAEAKAGRRFASGAASGLRRSLLATIAAGGGLNISERPDTIGEGNRNVGGRMVFTRAGKTINQWAETLAQSGFIPPGEVESDDGVRWLQDAISEEFAGRREHFAMDDEARMEEAARAAQGEEPALGDEPFGPLSDFDLEELSADGYAGASPEVQALTEQALAAADEAGIDIEALREDAARLTEGLSDDEYHAQLQASARAAIAQTRTDAARRDAGADQASKRDRGETADAQGDEGAAPEGLTLEAQDAQSLREKTEREAAAKAAEAKQKADEQRRLEREAIERETRDRARQDASAENFVLGQDANDALAGQGSIFDAPEPVAAPQPARPASVANEQPSGTEEAARAAGFTLKAYRGISKANPFNDTSSNWLTTNRAVAEAYADEVMGYDDPGVLTVMVRPDGLPRHDASRLTDEQRAQLGADGFGNPQAIGIYDRSDDHPLGGGAGPVTVIHAPKGATWIVNEASAELPAPKTETAKNAEKRHADARAIGEEAANDGAARSAPSAFTKAERAAWLAGYDAAAEANAAGAYAPISDAGEKIGGALKAKKAEAAAPPSAETAAKRPAPVAMPEIVGIPLDAAVAAHEGTSHVPEQRGAMEQRRFIAALTEAWEQAARAAGQDKAAIDRITEAFADIADGYRSRYMAYLGAHSRVVSSMIAGPSNFPVRRNEKRIETADRRAAEASDYLQRGVKRLLRAARGPIDNSPAAELENVRQNLALREEEQERMKAANAALRKGDDEALRELDYTDEQIAKLKRPDFAGRKGFPDYRLTNNNAEIRRLRERLKDAEARVAAAEAGPIESAREGARMVEDATDDRLRLIFDGKPSEAVRDDLKANGFKWSPKNEAWQRKLTDNARRAAELVLSKHFPPELKTREGDDGGVAIYSRVAANGNAGPTSREALRQRLTDEFGADVIDALEKAGLLRIANVPPASMPSDAAGVTEGERISLFAANTPAGSTAVAYHEALHATLRRMIGDAAFEALMRRMPLLAAGNRKWFAEAADRIPADTQKAARNSELASYAVEQYQRARETMPAGVRKWVQDLIAAIKVGLGKALQAAGVGLKLRVRLLSDARVLHKLARDGLRVMAREAGRGAMNEAPAFSAKAPLFYSALLRSVRGLGMKAANGLPLFSAAPQTDSAAFRKWFGDSKVVDAQGRPLVVYHGTPAGDIDVFKVSKSGSFGGGIYTTPDAWAASIYANEPVPTGRQAAPTVYPVYVSIKNPAPVSEAVNVGNWRGEQAVRDTLMDRGYDGVIDWRSGEIVAFRPEQIKSAIGNSGDFDPTNPDIRYSRAPSTDTAAFKKWFGASVVTENGKAGGVPLVVYHGTTRSFDTFDPNAPRTALPLPGIFFSPHPEIASAYAAMGREIRDADGFIVGAEGGNTVPVYLSIKNPILLRYDDRKTGRMTSYKTVEADLLAARKAGHDGAIIEGWTDGSGPMQYVAFRPEQIKSAIGNSGTFDGTNPDIRYSIAGTLGSIGGGTKMAGRTSRQHTPEQQRAMRNVGRIVEKPTLEQRVKELWKDAGMKLAQGLVDQFAPIKAISDKAYGLMRLSKGASGAFEAFLNGGMLKLTDGVYDFDETKRGGVVETLLQPLQGEHHDFLWWVAANRAERLASEGKENLFSGDDIDDLKSLADGTTDFDYTIQNGARAGQTTRDRSLIYEDSLKTFNSFNKNVLDMAEQSGLIDGASRAVWEHEFYVPFYRVADEDGGVRGMSVKGSAVRQEAFKTLKGGRNALNNDLLDNTLMNWAHLLDASAKNRAAVETLNAAESVGAAISSTESAIRDMSAAMQKKNGVVWVMEGGEKHFYLIEDPHLVTALTALDYAGMKGPVMDAMGTFKRVLTIGVTASPFFKVRNLIRDSIQAIGTGDIGYNAAANVAQGWKLTSPKSDAYFRLLAGGGTIHFGTMTEGNEGKRIQALVESGVDRSTILSDENSVKAFYRRFIEPGITAYNELGNRGEAINRASLYAQLRAKGVNHAEASLQARDLMDFSMQGSFTTVRFLTQVVPFFNARIQGLYKLGRSTKADPARMGIVLGATAAASLALLLAYSDDDDWKKREDWDRNNFWWFKFGGTAFRIPKPFEIGAIASLAERGFELAFSKEMTSKRFGQNVLELLGNNLSMNPVPQLVKPMLDVYANLDSFTGRPVESMGMERLRPEYRFTGRSSMLARGASTAANAVTNKLGFSSPSPVQIDHMLRGYFGWLGAFIIGASEIVVRPATGQVSQPMPDLFRAATGNMVSDLRDAPSQYVSQMYNQARELEEAYGTWRALLKSGKTEEAAEFRADNRDELNRYRFVERVKSDVSKINQRIRAIEQSDLGAMEKRLRIREANVMKDRLARRLEVH